jgi:hypothetical protein
MSKCLWWIKERDNPQTGTYFCACGQMSKREAKKREDPLYGSNIMRPYATEAEYRAALESLRAAGERVV